MSVCATDLLAAAEKAFSNADCEADLRGVLSRAYYSIYQDGEAFHMSLSSPGSLQPNSRGGKHQNLHEQLKNPTINRDSEKAKISRKIGALMSSLHVLRVKADYRREQHLAQSDPLDSIAGAKKIIELLQAPTEKPVVSPPEDPKGPTTGRPTLTRIK
ncbi:hypothetical protein [Collimonas fungivorans]|uniref:hypothetical protein n=1 Tax=Collimonas fungivorans TaxID=158899 RepID=UPI0011D210D1|nr:hypothetical protein [Collimonas fungivorans]